MTFQGAALGTRARKRPVTDAEIGDRARADFVADAIREAIREGRLKAGQRLRERDLGELLGVSRTPVREALKRLQSEGIVTAGPGRGLAIAELALGEVRELYAMWEELEGIAARSAAQHATELDVETLGRICDLWNPDADAATLGRLNHQFHRAIYRSAHNRFLVRMLEAIDEHLALLGVTTFGIAERRIVAGRQHREIVAAIARRDPAAAEAAARDHIRAAASLRLAIAAGIG